MSFWSLFFPTRKRPLPPAERWNLKTINGYQLTTAQGQPRTTVPTT